MHGPEFASIRRYLGKSQKQLAQLLCVSTKTIQSFEQGWRKIPVNEERHLLLFLSFKRSQDKNPTPCWEIKNCPTEWKEKCTAWEFKAGYLCWFINGTCCQGDVKDWREKKELCKQCEVLQSRLSIT